MHFKRFHNLIKIGARSISMKNKRHLLQDVDSMQGLKNFTYLLSRENIRVYVWGLAETGALGISQSLKQHKKTNCLIVQRPSRLSFGERRDVLDVSAGYGFSVFVVKANEDGVSLFGSGINMDSQIGFHKHRGETNRPIEMLVYPAPIFLPKENSEEKLQAVKAATGRAHTVILTESGAIFTLGNNAYGQCARTVIEDEEYLGSNLIHRLNLDVFQHQRVVDIVCGQDHSIFITDSGKIYSCGWGGDGQTGLGHYNNQHIPELLAGDISGEKIVKVSCVADLVLALNDKGIVFGWGNSEYGQICQDENVQQINVPRRLKFFKGLGKIVDIAAGGSFCAVLNESGDVFVWGFGLLGLGPNVEFCKQPTLIPPTIFGRNAFNTENRVISINCGLSYLAAINSDKDLFTWGRNKYGCLGLGHDKDQFFPFKTPIGAKVEKVSCGPDHIVAICNSWV